MGTRSRRHESLVRTSIVAVALFACLLSAAVTAAAQELGPGASFADSQSQLDQVVVVAPGLALEPGASYWVWLGNVEPPSMRLLGTLGPDEAGTPSLWWTMPTSENLLLATAEVIVSRAASNTVPQAPGQVVLRGRVDAGALPHLRRLLARWPETRYGDGSLQGVRRLLAQAQVHASLLGEAAANGDVAGSRRKAEHLANLLGGQSAAPYGDLDGDGVAEDPGDGEGILPYAAGALEQLRNVYQFAQDDGLAAQALTLEAPLQGFIQQVTAVRMRALELAATDDAAAAQELAALIAEGVAQLDAGTASDAEAAHPGLAAIYPQAAALARVQLRGVS